MLIKALKVMEIKKQIEVNQIIHKIERINPVINSLQVIKVANNMTISFNNIN